MTSGKTKPMKIFDRYLFKALCIATCFIAVVLTFIIFLTQSLRFLEIVMNSGAAASAFWMLTGLALPRFLEVILPLSLMSATLFLYNKMIIDSELIAMRAGGHSTFALAKPTLILGLITTIFLWGITLWVAPISLSKLQTMRVELKADLSNFLFREGVFNKVGKGLTFYIRNRTNNGELEGLMIHDTRDKTKLPSTVFAKRGSIIANESQQQVIVYEGSRQEYNPKSKTLQKLAFDQYTIELPENTKADKRWVQPDERTITELLNPDLSNKKDVKNLRDFKVEIHRRIAAPLLALAFPLIGLMALLIGPTDRRGQTIKIIIAVISVMLCQSLFIASYNLARTHDIGLIIMYSVTFTPIILSLFILSRSAENIRRKFFYRKGKTA